MKFKAFFLSSLFFLAMVNFCIASSVVLTPTTDFAKKIKSELSDIDMDFSKLNGETLRIRFMVNEKKEIIVLSTNHKSLDLTIKDALNYEELDSDELKPFEVYIVPVKFEKE